MKLATKKLLGALVFAGVATMMSVSAQAATYAATPVSGGTDYTFEASTTGSFTDYITFSLPYASDLMASVDGNASGSFTLTSFDLGTYVGGVFTAIESGIVSNFSNGKFSGFFGLTTGDTLAGSLALRLVGSGNGTYNGTISVSAVPEAETYVMLLAGVGLMGFVARRRKSGYAA